MNTSLTDRIKNAKHLLDQLVDAIGLKAISWFNPEQHDFLMERFSEIRASLGPEISVDDIDLHVHRLLAEKRKIAPIWCIDDVRGIRPDLTEEQAWEVLQQVGDHHDAEWGISWTTLETTADDLFPKPTSRRRKP